MIKAVIFDLGGVVLDFSNRDYYRYIARKAHMPSGEVGSIIENNYMGKIEDGSMTLKAFEENISRELKIPKEEVGWYDFYKREVEINPDVEELVEMLHNEYVTAFLSNIDESRYVYTRKILNLNAFDYKFASCRLKHRKPQAAIYRAVLKSMKMKPKDTVFIDNMLENVLGARKVGMNALHFINRRLLDRELAKLGV